MSSADACCFRYTLGDPSEPTTAVGPVISQPAKTRIQAHIDDALSKGAANATPPNASFQHPPADGTYVAPTLLANARHDMRIMREETFGPVIPVMAVSSDEEAVRLMNDSDYGLTASVWTEDIDTASKLIDEIDAGTVFVNRCDYPSPVSTRALGFGHGSCLTVDAGSRLDGLEGLGHWVHAGTSWI
jgi:acyl-CoA reductase-like NAD-dependent aldehyde dehydrogenase